MMRVVVFVIALRVLMDLMDVSFWLGFWVCGCFGWYVAGHDIKYGKEWTWFK
jgi:hypothetical protein